MNSIQQFLDWLQTNDPFMFDVISAKLAKEGQPLSGWMDIAKSVGSGLIAVAPAYLAYKGSKDAKKLQKAQEDYAQKQTAPTAPKPNTSALTDIQRRWKLALAGKNQPPSGAYKPFLPAGNNSNYQSAVSGTVSRMGTMTQIMIPLALVASFLLFRRLKK